MIGANYYSPGSRNPKTILVLAAILGVFALLGKSWFANLPEPVEYRQDQATVLSLTKKKLNSTGKYGVSTSAQYMFAELELENGKTFKTMIAKPYPQVGDKLPVRITTYSDGSEQAATISEY